MRIYGFILGDSNFMYIQWHLKVCIIISFQIICDVLAGLNSTAFVSDSGNFRSHCNLLGGVFENLWRPPATLQSMWPLLDLSLFRDIIPVVRVGESIASRAKIRNGCSDCFLCHVERLAWPDLCFLEQGQDRSEVSEALALSTPF